MIVSATHSKLVDQVRGEIRVKRYSIRTEQAYVDWIKRFIIHFDKRHPRDLGAAEVEAFLTHLAVEGRVAAYLAPFIRTVQELLGHKDVTTTMIYTRC